MAIYKRIQRTDGFTIMSNYHLRDMRLSLKASGLLSLVLSLPEDWKYSVAGLTAIVKEGKGAVMSALKELEENGYLCRLEHRENGRFQGLEYIFLEYPGQLDEMKDPNGHEQTIRRMQRQVAERMQEGMKRDKEEPKQEEKIQKLQKLKEMHTFPEKPEKGHNQASEPCTEKSETENRDTANPRVDVPPCRDLTYPENSYPENSYPNFRPQINKDIQKKDKQKDLHNLILSNQSDKKINQETKRDPMDVMDQRATCREVVRKNIDYDNCVSTAYRKDEVDELVELIVETLMLPDDTKTIRVGGMERPVSVVKSMFLKLTSEHIYYVLGCLHRTEKKIGNIKAYLLTALYNAPMTISSYYTTLANYDLSSGKQ